jgi:hypothetical protein
MTSTSRHRDCQPSAPVLRLRKGLWEYVSIGRRWGDEGHKTCGTTRGSLSPRPLQCVVSQRLGMVRRHR